MPRSCCLRRFRSRCSSWSFWRSAGSFATDQSRQLTEEEVPDCKALRGVRLLVADIETRKDDPPCAFFGPADEPTDGLAPVIAALSVAQPDAAGLAMNTPAVRRIEGRNDAARQSVRFLCDWQ